MTVAIAGRAPARAPFRGLEQFDRRGAAGEIGYCVGGARPYALEFRTDTDVICLLLGDLVTETKFEDDAERPLLFAGESSAFHPRGGNVRVSPRRSDTASSPSATRPRSRIGLTMSTCGGRDAAAAATTSAARRSLRLSRYARERLTSDHPIDEFEVESFASRVYLETMRSLGRFAEKAVTVSRITNSI